MDKIVSISSGKEKPPSDKEALIQQLSKVPRDYAEHLIRALTFRLEEFIIIQNVLLAVDNRPNLLRHLVGQLSPNMVERIFDIATILSDITENESDEELTVLAEKIWDLIYSDDPPPAG